MIHHRGIEMGRNQKVANILFEDCDKNIQQDLINDPIITTAHTSTVQ